MGDLNRDGIPDLVVLNGSSSFTIQFGNGDGTFQHGTTFTGTLPGEIVTMRIADMNGDNLPDIVLEGNQFSGAGGAYVAILLQQPDGTFLLATSVDTGIFLVAIGGPDAFAIGDYNDDGKPDIVTADGFFLVVLLGNGDGTLKPPLITNQPQNIGGMIASDFNGDGKPDIAVGLGSTEISVLLGNGDGTFRQGSSPGSLWRAG